MSRYVFVLILLSFCRYFVLLFDTGFSLRWCTFYLKI